MLKELLSELETRRKSRQSEFWAIAHKLAGDERVTPAAVERVLAECGKTPTELQTAVEMIQRRRKWHEIISAEPALLKEQTALKDRIAAEDKKLASAEQAHADATGPMYVRLEFIKAHVSDASDARRLLLQTCPYAELKAELAETQERLNEQRNRLAALKRQADRARDAEDDLAEARRHEQGVTAGSDPRRAAEWRERAERNQRASDAAKTELPAVEKDVARLEKTEAAIYAKMLTP